MSTLKVYQQCWKEWAGWCVQESVQNKAISAPFGSFIKGWSGLALFSAISAFLEPLIFIRLLIILSSLN